MRRQILIGGLLTAIAIAALLVWSPSPQEERCSKENFLRIRKGMSLAHVEEILGSAKVGPPDSDDLGVGMPVFLDRDWALRSERGPELMTYHWTGRSCIIELYVAIPGQNAVGVQTGRASPRRGSVEDLRGRVRLQWQRWFPD